MTTLVTAPDDGSTVITAMPLPVMRARRASYGYSGRGALIATALADDMDMVPPGAPAGRGRAIGAMLLFAFARFGGRSAASSTNSGGSTGAGGASIGNGSSSGTIGSTGSGAETWKVTSAIWSREGARSTTGSFGSSWTMTTARA